MARFAIQLIILVFFYLSDYYLLAQSDIRTGSLKKEITLGEPLDIYLVYEHDPELSILFPDTNFNFHPFELIRKRYFPTITHNSLSKDCTIYQVRLFNIIPDPQLSIPVYIYTGNDSLSIYPEPVSLKLVELLEEIPNHPVLKESPHWENITQKINLPLIIAILLLITILLSLSFRFLGKPVLQRIRIYYIIQNHRRFVTQFEKLEGLYIGKRNTNYLKSLLSLWKDYLSSIEGKPIATYTSTEIIGLFRKEDLKDSLIIIDKVIFGGITSEAVITAISTLKKFANSRYIHRKNELRKG